MSRARRSSTAGSTTKRGRASPRHRLHPARSERRQAGDRAHRGARCLRRRRAVRRRADVRQRARAHRAAAVAPRRRCRRRLRRALPRSDARPPDRARSSGSARPACSSDAILYNDTWTTARGTRVWESAVTIDEQGWSAEMRIPLSQLRFPFGDRADVGRQRRALHPAQERDRLARAGAQERERPRLADGAPDRPRRHPARARTSSCCPTRPRAASSSQPRRAGNPFNDGSRAFAPPALDLKYGLTSNLTLDGTINPDFGQVEVDPAVVNLTAVRDVLRREAAVLHRGRRRSSPTSARTGPNNFWGFNTSEPAIFYSRRIGRAPQVAPSGDFVDRADGDDDPRRREAHRQDRGRLEPRPARRGDRPRDRAHPSAAIRGARPSSRSPTTSSARLQRDLGRRAGVGVLATAGQSPARHAGDAGRPRLTARIVLGADAHLFLDDDRELGRCRQARRRAGSQGTTATITRAAARAAALLPAARRAARDARSDADVARRLHRPDQPQSQQRPAARQRRVVGRQPRLRDRTTSAFSRHRRSRRRARRRASGAT